MYGMIKHLTSGSISISFIELAHGLKSYQAIACRLLLSYTPVACLISSTIINLFIIQVQGLAGLLTGPLSIAWCHFHFIYIDVHHKESILVCYLNDKSNISVSCNSSTWGCWHFVCIMNIFAFTVLCPSSIYDGPHSNFYLC